MSKRGILLLVALLTLSVALPAAADHEAVLLDACDGVDHPPFDRDYEGDGLSYVLVAVRVDLPPGTVLTAAIFEEGTAETGEPVSAVEGTVGDDGTVEFALPINQFGTYDIFVGDADHDHPFLTARRVVDASEAPCTAADVAATDGATPTEGMTTEASPEPTATDATDEATATTEPTPEVTPTEPTVAEDTGGSFPWLGLLVAILIIAVIGGWWLSQRRRTP